MGLVDCKTEGEYVQQLKATKMLWDDMQNRHRQKELFSVWFQQKQSEKIWYGYGHPFRKRGNVHTTVVLGGFWGYWSPQNGQSYTHRVKNR